MQNDVQGSKLTVRIARDLIENAKQFANRNNTTLTRLIEAYLGSIPADRSKEHRPIVRWLTGRASSKVTIAEYRKHLEGKYGQKDTPSDRS